MRKLSLCLIGFLLVFTGNALFEETNEVQKITTNMDLARAYLQLDFLTAVLFFRNTPRSKSIEPVFIEFAETKKDYYRFLAVDCDELEHDKAQQLSPACREDFKQNLPQILFLEPPLEKIDPNTKRTAEPIQHRYEGAATTEDFIEFAKKHQPSFSKRLVTVEELNKFLDENKNTNKVLYISNKKSVPQYWKALSSKFRDTLTFGEVLSKGKQIYEHFDVQKFPTVIVFTQKDGDLTETTYKGELDYESLEKYLNKNAVPKKPPTPPKTEEKKPQTPQEPAAPPKPTIKDITPENFEETVYGTEGLVLIHLFKGEESHKTFQEVVSKFNSILDIYNLDVSDPKAQKFSESVLQVKHFPAYRLYPIGNKDKKSKSKIVFTKTKKFKDIGRDISDLIEDPLLALTPVSFSPYLQRVVTQRKPALFLFHNQDDISMSLRILAQFERYKNHINFAHFKNPPEDIRSQFTVEKLPKIAVVFVRDLDRKDITLDDGVQTASYTGKFSYNELRHYLDTFLPASATGPRLSKAIPQVDSLKDFKNVCQGKHGCIIGILDGFAGNDNSEYRVKNELLKLEKAKNASSDKSWPFVWFDGACHPEFTKAFDITTEQLPTLVYYDASKKAVSQLSGAFDSDNIDAFLKEVAQGVESSIPVSGVPKIDNKVCGIHHQQRGSEILAKLSPTPQTEWVSIPTEELVANAKVTTKDEL